MLRGMAYSIRAQELALYRWEVGMKSLSITKRLQWSRRVGGSWSKLRAGKGEGQNE
jgi:hypothetical protein